MNGRLPRVSIGLPVYNGENFLSSALDCVLGQTYEDFELVISDNASTDRSEEICREYASRDDRVRYFRETENRGMAWNFSQVFRLSRGEYFKWMAHDDLCDPTFLQQAVGVLDRDPSVALCFAKAELIDHRGERLGLIEDALGHGRGKLHAAQPHQRYLDVLLYCVFGIEFYGLIRAEVLRATGLLRPYCLAEKVLIAELALHGKCHEIPEVLLSYRWHEDQFTQVSSVAARQRIANAGEGRPIVLPYRVASTLGYLRIIGRAKVGLWEGFLCLLMLARYLLQMSKWKRGIRDALTGMTVWKNPMERHTTDEDESPDRLNSGAAAATPAVPYQKKIKRVSQDA